MPHPQPLTRHRSFPNSIPDPANIRLGGEWVQTMVHVRRRMDGPMGVKCRGNPTGLELADRLWMSLNSVDPRL